MSVILSKLSLGSQNIEPGKKLVIVTTIITDRWLLTAPGTFAL
jgi:hypothetical protein